jgi:hypothetical protein
MAWFLRANPLLKLDKAVGWDKQSAAVGCVKRTISCGLWCVSRTLHLDPFTFFNGK